MHITSGCNLRTLYLNQMKPTVYLSYVMIVLLCLLALVCFFVPTSSEWLPGNRRFIMGGVLLLYSAVRFVRLKKYIKLNENRESEK